MWLITGPFDSEQLGDEISKKTKLLKTNRVYGVGRHKDSPLFINNKKVSRQNGEFIVGEHTEDDVSNAASIPTLSLRNNKTAAIKVSRGDSSFAVNPDSTNELESGDVIRLAGNVNATVIWDPKICFYMPSNDVPVFDLPACASAGLKVVNKHSRDVTHHIIASITSPLDPSILLSLLNPAQLVNSQWLVELIRRGKDAGGIEKTYDPLPETSYRPLIAPELAEIHPFMSKNISWNPNENRKALFDGIRFVFAVIGSGIGSTTKAMADIVSRGGADRQLINVEREAEVLAKGTAGTWGIALRKRKTVLKEGMRSGLVLVGDKGAMMAKGVPRDITKTWEDMVEKASRVNMRIIPPSLIAEAIFKVDVSLLDCVTDGIVDADSGESSSNPKALPDFIPSTLPEERPQLPSAVVSRHVHPTDTETESQQAPQVSQTSGTGPTRRLTRRTTSQTPAPEPALPVISMEVEGAPRKKLLKRRARTGGLVNELLGLDDTTILDEAQSSQEQSQSAPRAPDIVPPTPARPSRLKRRAGTAPSSQLFPELQATPEDGDEPPLKKFKALFEQSGQGNVEQTEAEDESLMGGRSGVPETQLAAVLEEEEEEEESQDQTQARKRKADAMEQETRGDPDVEMRDAEGSSMAKKRAIEAVNAVEPSQDADSQIARTAVTSKNSAKSTKNGAIPGKPDTDPSFLRAIASNKRGKRTEDDFDREFNQLRIAKPDINNADSNMSNAVQWAQEWDGLDDFEKDVGIRGNFMQVVELKVWKDVRNDQPGRNTRRESGLGARLDWDGREDFKKFRRKMNNGPREVVQLVVSEQQDYDAEAPYFDYNSGKKLRGFDDMSQSQLQDHSYSRPIFTQMPSGSKSRLKSQSKQKPKPRVMYEEVDEDEEVEEVAGGTGKGKGKSQASGKTRTSQIEKNKQPLFALDSEDEDLPPEPNAFTDETLDNAEEPPDMTLRSTRGATQTQNEKSQSKTRGTKRKIVLEEESDSDQGLTFGGFSKKAKKKKR